MHRRTAILFLFLFLPALATTAYADEHSDMTSAPDRQELSGKIAKIMDTQTEILKQLEELKKELAVIRIRVSQNQ